MLEQAIHVTLLIDSIAVAERLGVLDATVAMFRHPERFHEWGMSRVESLAIPAQRWLLDINIPLRRINQHYDALEAVAALPNAAEQSSAAKAREEEFREATELGPADFFEPTRMGLLSDGPWPVKRWLVSDHTAKMILRLLVPALHATFRVELQADQRLSLQPVLIALGGYRAEHGAYPATLDALVPGWLDAVPGDLYAPGEPVRYVMLEGKPAVYSVGPDGIDDAEKDEPGVDDDIGLRIGGRFDAHQEQADREEQP